MWYEVSCNVINNALKDYPRNCRFLTREERLKIRAKVRQAYPFGQRINYPYKQWNKAIRTIFEQRGLFEYPKQKTLPIYSRKQP